MPFVPLGERHAIAEVAFGLKVSPSLTHDDREALKAAHPRWQAHLPRLLESKTLAVHLSGPGGKPPPPPVSPLDFVRYKSDGNFDWRLHIQDDSITVNCLAYTRWQHVWTHARALFSHVSEVLPDTIFVVSVSLQYINLFSWDGPLQDYDSGKLLDESSDSIPESVFNRGPHWHLYQGWFSPITDPPGGRILDRMHIEGIGDEHRGHLVKFESLFRWDFDGDDGSRLLKQAFSAPPTFIDASFERLHDLTKRSLAGYLTPDAERIINLHAE